MYILDKKEIGKAIVNLLNNPEYRIQVVQELNEMYEGVIKNLTYNNVAKERVLNVFLLNAYNSFTSFIKLASDRHYIDAILLSRKIIEILIRQEYLTTTGTFDSYLREKSQEQAKILNSLISTHPIEYVSETALWKMRHEIIKDCEKIYNDKKNNTFKETPSLETMAEKSSLLTLYKKSYGAYSKFVHINMSIENIYLYRQGEKLHYITSEQDISIQKDMIKPILNDTIYCYYLILKNYCKQLTVNKDKLKEFESNHFLFVSFDLITGRTNSNIGIANNIMKNLFGDENLYIEDTDFDKKVTFIENDVEILKSEWINLKKIVREKEAELES